MIIDKNIPRKERITRDRLQFIPGTQTPLMSVVEIVIRECVIENVHFVREVIQNI